MPIVANSSLVLFCTLPFSASLYILPVNANRYNICLSHTAIIYHCQCLRYFLRVCSFIGDFLISAISLLYLQLTIENDATNGSSKSCFLPGLCHCITYKVSLPHIYIYIYIYFAILLYIIYTQQRCAHRIGQSCVTPLGNPLNKNPICRSYATHTLRVATSSV